MVKQLVRKVLEKKGWEFTSSPLNEKIEIESEVTPLESNDITSIFPSLGKALLKCLKNYMVITQR